MLREVALVIEGGIHNNSMMEREGAHIMIVARAGTLYQSLAHTMQEQFRGCQALICEAGAAIADCDGDIRLVLIHVGCGAQMAREIEAQRTLHPAAAIAILIDDAEMLTPSCCELFAERKVQGILPLTLKLEVWLAAVLLLLSGGEYYPVTGRRETHATTPMPPSTPAPIPARAPAPTAAPVAAAPALSSLTAREQEILELLSEGHQNKLIAHRMSLSEHTVKVHVHNLLSKLRVSNRTQAAATYRRGTTGPSAMAVPRAARGAGDAGGAVPTR